MRKYFFCFGIVMLLLAAPATPAPARDYTLADVYREALIHSEKMELARENVAIAQTGRGKAMSLLMPRLTAFGTYNLYSEQKRTDAGTLIQPRESGTWGLRADQGFSLSARELDALAIAGQSVVKSEYDLAAARSDFVLAVASAYFDVLKTKKTLEITAANLERLTHYRQSVAKRVQVGELTRTALLRAEGELSGARADFLRATNALRLSRAALVRLTGIDEAFRLVEENTTPDASCDLGRMRQTAMSSRPDLQSYDVQTQIAGRQVTFARGAFWPSLGLFAVYNRADQDNPTPSLNRESLVAGVSLSFPFFEGGLRLAELREAKARERQARLMYEDFRKTVDIELQRACLELETQQGALNYLEDQETFARDNYNAVLRQFENGLATSLDVMDANSLLLASEKNLVESQYNFRLADLSVRRAAGTLLEYVGIEK